MKLISLATALFLSFTPMALAENTCPGQNITDLRAVAVERGLDVTEHTGLQLEAIKAVLVDRLGPAPFEFDLITVVAIPEMNVYRIGFFFQGCIQHVAQADIPVWQEIKEQALSRRAGE